MPLLERLKFCAIYESNLDEFFMVRVANLHDQLEAGVDARGADGMSTTTRSTRSASWCWASASGWPAASSASFARRSPSTGIRIISPERASPAEHEQLDRVYVTSIFPALTPLAIGLGRPFPYISNLSLSLAVSLHDPDQGTDVLARVKVPKELLGRFVKIGEGERRWFPSRT